MNIFRDSYWTIVTWERWSKWWMSLRQDTQQSPIVLRTHISLETSYSTILKNRSLLITIWKANKIYWNKSFLNWLIKPRSFLAIKCILICRSKSREFQWVHKIQISKFWSKNKMKYKNKSILNMIGT